MPITCTLLSAGGSFSGRASLDLILMKLSAEGSGNLSLLQGLLSMSNLRHKLFKQSYRYSRENWSTSNSEFAGWISDLFRAGLTTNLWLKTQRWRSSSIIGTNSWATFNWGPQSLMTKRSLVFARKSRWCHRLLNTRFWLRTYKLAKIPIN